MDEKRINEKELFLSPLLYLPLFLPPSKKKRHRIKREMAVSSIGLIKVIGIQNDPEKVYDRVCSLRFKHINWIVLLYSICLYKQIICV